MKQPLNFEYEGIQLTAFVDEENEGWFRGTEACKCLKFSNSSVAIKNHAPEDWKEIQVGKGRPAIYVSETGLYRLICASKSVDAEKFKIWLFGTIVPSITKNNDHIESSITIEAGGRIEENKMTKGMRTLLAPYPYLLAAFEKLLQSPDKLYWVDFVPICDGYAAEIELKKHLAEGEYDLKAYLIDTINAQILSTVTKPVTIDYLFNHVDNCSAAGVLAACMRLTLPIKYTATSKNPNTNLLNAIVSPAES